jgi:hypothetical protein
MKRRWAAGMAAIAILAARMTAAGADAHATALDAADRILARCDALTASDDNAAHRAATVQRIDELKKRRDELRATFDQSKYDELRVDLNLEYQRLAAWMARPITPPLEGKTPLQPEASVFQFDPAPDNPAEVQAALAALEREIRRQEDRLATGPANAARKKLAKHLDAARRGQRELAKGFSRATWAAVIAELRAAE